MNTKNSRSLSETISELYALFRRLHERSFFMKDGARLQAALLAAADPREGFDLHSRALDELAGILIECEYFREAAFVTHSALAFLKKIGSQPMDGDSLILVRCYLLAKHAHATSRSAQFLESANASNELGRELMAAHGFGIDFPVREGGIAALIKHLVSNSCAPRRYVLIGYCPSTS